MKQPGVEVRPIEQMDRSRGIQRGLLHQRPLPRSQRDRRGQQRLEGRDDHARLRARDVVDHWPSPFQEEFDEILELARQRGLDSDLLTRQRLARSWSKIKIMEINGYRTLTDALQGTHRTAALGACNKMFWSEMHQASMLLAMDILGMQGQLLMGGGSGEAMFGGRQSSSRYPVSSLQSSYFFSRSETIWGGSAEIQRNIVGERVLGLPKEPRPG